MRYHTISIAIYVIKKYFLFKEMYTKVKSFPYKQKQENAT